MITVFTSCYNQAEFLPQAIESVLAQTYTDFEYLLYDDGSTDDTWEIMREYEKQDGRIRAFQCPKQPNKAYLMNESLLIAHTHSSGWLWCPADDRLLPECIEEKMMVYMHNPYSVIYSYGHYIDGNGTLCGKFAPDPPPSPEEFRRLMKTRCQIGFTGVFIPWGVYGYVGSFPEHEDYCEDFEWILRACKLGVNFLCIPEYLYEKRKHTNCVTGQHIDKILDRVDTIRKRVGWYDDSK